MIEKKSNPTQKRLLEIDSDIERINKQLQTLLKDFKKRCGSSQKT
jgi:hypothetical protein